MTSTGDLGRVLGQAGGLVGRSGASSVSEKQALDYVSDVDLRVDAFLENALAELTPGVPVLSEERPLDRDVIDRSFWIVDPLDGTHNYLAGVRYYAICAALVHGHQVELAGVLDLASADLYLAERGGGASLNGEPLRVPGRASRLIGISSGALDDLNGRRDVYDELRVIGKLRNLGSQALHLCLVAGGQLGMAISAEARLWDDAAGRLIAEEAGARYTSFAAGDDHLTAMGAALAGDPLRSLCAHPELEVPARRLMSTLWRGD